MNETCRIPYAFYYLAELYKKTQNTDEALELFIAASQISPSFGEAFANAGSLLLDKGKTKHQTKKISCLLT